MPAEPTQAKLKRRTSRKELDERRFDSSHSREVELKRTRGEISCAECRRLKIKCDKQVPCQSCQRRGCASLCPNGSLATGQGTRFVLAATEHLHKKIARYGVRIRELEDALAALQAKHSDEAHPLLRQELMDLSRDKSEEVHLFKEEPLTEKTNTNPPDVIDAFGTLSISDYGISRFFGPTGGSESLLIAGLSHADSETGSPTQTHSAGSPASVPCSDSPSSGPFSDPLFSQSFPFTPLGNATDVQRTIETHLPAQDRAIVLLNIYFDEVGWLYRGVTREQVFGEMLPAIYINQSPGSSSHTSTRPDDYSGPHDLALLFGIFAIGALLEPQPTERCGPHTTFPDALSPAEETRIQEAASQAEHYHQISKAALCLQPVLEKPSLVTIQTLHIMSVLKGMSGSDATGETNMEMTWSLISLASNLSQTIGLHRDSARWGLSLKQVQRRRVLFWDLFTADIWQSLHTGRPPSFSLAYVDCGYPEYSTEFPAPENGEPTRAAGNFESWGFRFSAEVIAEVAARTLTAEAPTYATIMEMDRKVREFPNPGPSLDAAGENKPSLSAARTNEDMASSFVRCVGEHIKETILLYIHRSFFAQAIIDDPVNPLKSVYAPSFLAAYRASTTILKSVRQQFDIWPVGVARYWTMLAFAFSAAVVFGTVVTRGPRSALASSAMTELEQACVMFSKAALYSYRAKKSLPILTRLRSKAKAALTAAQNDVDGDSSDKGAMWNMPKQDRLDDELSIFAGHTRFISSQRTTTRSPTPQSTIKAEPVSQGDTLMASYDGTPLSDSPLSVHISAQQQIRRMSVQQPSPIQLTPEYMTPDPTIHVQPPLLQTPSRDQWMYHQEAQGPSSGFEHRSTQPPPPLSLQADMMYRTSSDRTQMSPYTPQSHHHHVSPTAMTSDSFASWQPLPSEMEQRYDHHQQAGPSFHPQHQQQLPTPTSSHFNMPPLRSDAQHLGPSASYHTIAPNHHQPHPQHTQQRHRQHQHPPPHQGYSIQYAPHSELADLGLAARDSRLDQRWCSFMEDSGLLDGGGAQAGPSGLHGRRH